MSAFAPRGPGRYAICAWHPKTQGHSPTCPRGRCCRCKQFTALPGTRHCAWCGPERERERGAAS